MTETVSGQHTIVVRSGLGLPAVVEATAMLTAGFVEAPGVGDMHFLYTFAESGPDEVAITARLRHPQSENPVRKALTPLYSLLAGFYKAGAAVTVIGQLAAVLPGEGRLAYGEGEARPELAIRQIFEDHLAPEERTPPIEPAVLTEVFHALTDLQDFKQHLKDSAFRAIFPEHVKDHRDDASHFLTHRSGLEFSVVVKHGAVDAHVIHKHRPVTAWMPFSFTSVMPELVRTWGEVWVNLARGGEITRPAGLEILPREIASIAPGHIERFIVQDRSTLDDLTNLSFGPGASPRYSGALWLAYAEQYGERKEYHTAIRCAEQAALLDESPEMNAQAQEEILRWQGWLAFAQEQAQSDVPRRPPEQRNVPVRPLAELLELFPGALGEQLSRLSQEIQWEVQEAHDYRRQTQPLRQWQAGSGDTLFTLDYRRVTGQTLLDAGVSTDALAHLGYSFAVIPPPVRLDDIFTVTAGGWVIWGTVDSQRLILREDPAAVYSAIC